MANDSRPSSIPSILRAQNNFNNTVDDVRGSFVDAFAECFNRNRNGQNPPPTGRRHPVKRKRGRPAQDYHMNIIALADPNSTRRPQSWKVLKNLQADGLGRLSQDVAITAGLNERQFVEFLWEKFPRLQGMPLRFKRSNAEGKLHDLPENTLLTPAGIQNRRTCLYVLPTRELPQNTCQRCGRTMTGSGCLVCRQDAEYAESLITDQEKEKRARERSDDCGARLSELRAQRAEMLANVPPGGITVRCRLPSGTTIERKFRVGDHTVNLLNWIGSAEDATEDVALSIPGRPTIHSLNSCSGMTLEDIGISAPIAIMVSWIEDKMDGSDGAALTTTPGTSGAALLPGTNGAAITTTPGTNVASLTTTPGTSGAALTTTPGPRTDRAALTTTLGTSGAALTTTPGTSGAALTTTPGTSGAALTTTPRTSGAALTTIPGTSGAVILPGTSGTPSVSFPLINNNDSDDDFYLPDVLDLNNTTVSEGLPSSPEVYPPDDYDIEHEWKIELKQLQTKVCEDHIPTANCINVVRGRVMDGALRAWRRKTFDPLKKLNIMFVDDYNESELAVDNGGPTREFFRLLLQESVASMVFEGPEEARRLSLSTQALSQKLYEAVGCFLAMSLLHGGPSPSCLSDMLYKRVTNQKTSVSLEDVGDDTVCMVLRKIQDATTITDINSEIISAHDMLSMLGSVRHVKTKKQRDAVVQDSLQFYLFERLQAAEQQFVEGLQTGGLLDVVRKHPDAFQHLFMCSRVAAIDRTRLDGLFHPILSEANSNRRRKESTALGFWKDWLIDIEDGESPVTFEQILIFTTGLGEVPPLGFATSPAIEFLHDGGQLPTANTCALILRLPLNDDYGIWKSNMERGIRGAPTFGVN